MSKDYKTDKILREAVADPFKLTLIEWEWKDGIPDYSVDVANTDPTVDSSVFQKVFNNRLEAESHFEFIRDKLGFEEVEQDE